MRVVTPHSNAYLYCVYALVGGTISIRGRYNFLCRFTSQRIARCLPQPPPSVICAVKTELYRLQTSIEAYFAVKKALGRRSCLRWAYHLKACLHYKTVRTRFRWSRFQTVFTRPHWYNNEPVPRNAHAR